MRLKEFAQPPPKKSDQVSPVGSVKPRQPKDAAKKRVEELSKQMKRK